MRTERILVFFSVLLLGGCGSLDDWSAGKRHPPAAASATEAELVAGHLELMSSLGAGTAAQQAEIAEAARVAFLADPGTAARLRYGLVLATPGHGGSDPAGARTLLGDVLATPERLLPAERALAEIVYRDVNAKLALEAEIRELRMTAQTDDDRAKADAAQRRLQAQLQQQVAETARLRRELDEALAKLEAVANLEKSLVERQSSPPRRP